MRWGLRAGRGMLPNVTETVRPYQRCGAQNRTGASGDRAPTPCGATLARRARESEDPTAARGAAQTSGPPVCSMFMIGFSFRFF